MFSIAVVSIQWWVIGYSLAYSEGDGLVGDLAFASHRGVLAEPVGAIPALLFSQFQLVFCATVCAITVGGFWERGRLLPIIPFIALWATLVYCPLAHQVKWCYDMELNYILRNWKILSRFYIYGSYIRIGPHYPVG